MIQSSWFLCTTKEAYTEYQILALILRFCVYTGCLNKKETGTNHLNRFGYYLLEGYLLFTTVPRNVVSVMSVNEHEHFKDRLTI